MTRRRPWLLLVAVPALATAGGCRDQGSRTRDQLEALQRKKVAEAEAKRAAKEKAEAPAKRPHVGGLYDETQALVLSSDGQCPEGLWALFPGEAPGTSPEEKKANEARRADLAKRLSQPMVVLLSAPGKVTLSPHDAANGKFVIEVAGAIDCIDSTGHTTIAWTPAKAGVATASAVSRGAEVLPNIWSAPPLTFELPMKGLSEAKAFYESNRFGISARVAITLGKGEVDTKLKKVGKVSKAMPDEKLEYGGGVEDWGAGRLVRANLVGVRVATEREQHELFDRR